MHNVSYQLPAPPPPAPPLAHDLLDPTADLMAAASNPAGGLINALTPGGVMPVNPSLASAVMSEDERKIVSESNKQTFFSGLFQRPLFNEMNRKQVY